jgi:hypothetical protein
MVVMALVTTFMTTPAVIKIYPKWYQMQTSEHSESKLDVFVQDNSGKHYCLVTLLNKLESVPSVMALMQLLKRDRSESSDQIHALRLLELTQRTSAVMKSKDLTETERKDPILNVLRTFSSLMRGALTTHLDVCPAEEYVKLVSNYSIKVEADLVLLPWVDRFESGELLDLDFVDQTFTIRHCTVGLFIDRGFGQTQDQELDLIPDLVVLYRDGPDDHAALLLALRMQAHRNLNLTVLRLKEGNSKTYASGKAIREMLLHGKANIDNLFIIKEKTNVVCQCITEFQLGESLGKHDLVFVGRRSIDQQTAPLLGTLAHSLLQNETSMIVVQERETC